MRFLVLFSALLAISQCGYPVAPQGSYPTPPPSDSYVVPKESYPTAPAAYATKPQYGQKFNSAPVPPPPPPPNPSLAATGYSDNDVSVSSVQSAPPSTPIADSTLAVAPAAPTYGGSVSSGSIAGGSALNYNTAPSASPAYRRRAKAKARARARAPTRPHRRFQRRPLQPIRRFQKKARQ